MKFFKQEDFLDENEDKYNQTLNLINRQFVCDLANEKLLKQGKIHSDGIFLKMQMCTHPREKIKYNMLRNGDETADLWFFKCECGLEVEPTSFKLKVDSND